MSLEGCKLYIGDSGGTIEVWSVASQDNEDELVPANPDLRWDPTEVGVATTSGGQRSIHAPFYPRCVRCLAAYKGHVYWGDDGTNVKVLQCETGVFNFANFKSYFRVSTHSCRGSCRVVASYVMTVNQL